MKKIILSTVIATADMLGTPMNILAFFGVLIVAGVGIAIFLTTSILRLVPTDTLTPLNALTMMAVFLGLIALFYNISQWRKNKQKYKRKGTIRQ